MTMIDEKLPRIRAYFKKNDWSGVPIMFGTQYTITPLAQGEYNLNYRVDTENDTAVFRVNIGTQIDREDQILYEYKALKLLEKSRVTPVAYFVDDSRKHIDHGALLMAYLPGRPLSYVKDPDAAAWLFSVIHQTDVPDEKNHLIREKAPLTLIYDECKDLLNTYFDSPLADPEISGYLSWVLAWAGEAKSRESWFQADPWFCIVNTEVNSHNFIVNSEAKTIHLVDWEMPRFGDPSQDLSHFCAPLTTLWKTEYRMSKSDKRRFIKSYAGHMADRHLQDTIYDRVRLKDPFVYLRGISWSAMGWVRYQQDFDGVKNPDTRKKLNQYMNLNFIRSLFDPFLAA